MFNCDRVACLIACSCATSLTAHSYAKIAYNSVVYGYVLIAYGYVVYDYVTIAYGYVVYGYVIIAYGCVLSVCGFVRSAYGNVVIVYGCSKCVRLCSNLSVYGCVLSAYSLIYVWVA
jgi:hypothetical protein